MSRSIRWFSIVLALCSFAAAAAAMNRAATARAPEASAWPSWRGPFGNGVAAEGKYPTEWTADEHIAWQVELSGRGASTPVIAGDRLFVTSADETTNLLQAFDLDGKRVWRVEIGKARAGKHEKATGSNSSPITDGQFVYAYFKSGDVACCTTDGQIVWQKNLQSEYGEDTLWWDLGTSPVLTEQAVVIAVMQSGPSYLLALDRKSGKQLWQAKRELPAPNEANQSYSTPIVTHIDGQEVLLTLGADHLTCHAASDGKLLWKLGGFNPDAQQYFRSIASPVLAGELVICPYARGNSLTAVKLHAASEDDRVAWERTDLGSDVPTPTVSGERLYVVGDRGKLSCLKAASGETIWEDQLPKSRHAFSSSPIVAGGHVYVTREDATTFVVKDGDKFELVATNSVPGRTVATPALANSSVFLRTYDHLYCIRAKSGL